MLNQKTRSLLYGFGFAFLAFTGIATGDSVSYPIAKVSFDDFKTLVAEVEPHRAQRLIDFNAFIKMSRKPDAIVFDSRSDFRYERVHLKGAKHLAFTDFTQANLAKVIPSLNTTILIYCNNNFDGNQIDFASKVAMPMPDESNLANRFEMPKRDSASQATSMPTTPASQFQAQGKPVMLALNVPTYVTLYGYGYRNIYELHELVNVKDPRVELEGSIVNK